MAECCNPAEEVHHKAIHIGDKRADLKAKHGHTAKCALPDIIFDDKGYPIIVESSEVL